MKEVKELLSQNVKRAINKADRCGKIPLERWVPDMCANVIRNSERDEDEKEEEIDEDEDNKYVLGDTLEELD